MQAKYLFSFSSLDCHKARQGVNLLSLLSEIEHARR